MSKPITPVISFIIPTTPAWAPYVLRFLRSLERQTAAPSSFEVVLGVDGGDDGAIAAVLGSWPFAVRAVNSPRPKGDVPHRNHARNAAIAESVGEYLWVADCDFVWSSNAVSDALAAIASADAHNEAVCLTPVLRRIDLDHAMYLPHTEEWAAGRDEQPAEAFAADLPTDMGEYSGNGALYQPDAGLRIVEAQIEEGFPLAPRAVFDALGGFDESFLRWGGNKIELCFRLTSLAGVGLPYRLLASVCAWHQPHPQDPNKPLDDPHRVANQALYRKRVREVRQGAPWWVEQRDAVKRYLLELGERVERTAVSATVGLVKPADRRKGIHHDVEMLEECLTGGPMHRRGGQDPVILPYSFDTGGPGHRSLEGATWPDFCDRCDVIVLSEVLPVDLINEALARAVRVIYMPNADWACINGSTDVWVKLVKAFSRRKGFTVWAKTPRWRAALAELGIESVGVPWVTLDPVAREREAPSGPVRFFASLGMGGYQGRRGADVIMAAWTRLGVSPDVATLRVKSIKPAAELGVSVPDGVEVIAADWSRAELRRAWASADVVLYPTRWDGFGLSLSEALAGGCAVIGPDMWPMNEQIEHEHNGLLIDRNSDEMMRLAPRAEPRVEDLVSAMRRLIDEPRLLRRLMAPQPGLLRAKQHALRLFVRSTILGDPPPSVVIVRGDGATPAGGRRSEMWWSTALERLGYRVTVLAQSDLAAAPDLAADFVLVGKCTPAHVDRIRRIVDGAPVICWHLDLTDFTKRRLDWQRAMLRSCDLCIVSEGDLGRFEGNIATIYPGQELTSRRPAGAEPAKADGVVFLGNCLGPSDARARRVRDFGDVTIHGSGWDAVGAKASPPVHGEAALAAYRGRYGLSISRTASRPGYTSNRFMQIMAAGGVPIVERFPGLEKLVDVGAITVLGSNPQGDPMRCAEIAWRRYTWEDAMLELIGMAEPRQSVKAPVIKPGARFAEMWDSRARELGPRAVAHISWTDTKFERQTGKWWLKFRRHLGRFLKPRDRRILDYGCGIGRFSGLLAGLGREVVGVDVAKSMLNMARQRVNGCTFQHIDSTRPLPFADNSFNVVFTSTVLQHIPDGEIDLVVAELRRVLVPNGIAFLFENCHTAGVRESGSGHVVFRGEGEYRMMFQGVNELESWFVEGEKHAILAGRIR